jgi:hypothetical protein
MDDSRGENVTRRLPRTDDEANLLKPAIAKLLRTIPEAWAECDSDGLTAQEQNALFLLVAAGMVERRLRFRLAMANHPVAIEAVLAVTGEYGGVEAMQAVVAKTWHLWEQAWREWNAGESRGVPPVHCESLKPHEWRLTEQGTLARKELEDGKPAMVYDFVLKRGVYDGKPRQMPDGSVYRRGPVRGHGKLERLAEQSSAAPAASVVNLGNWSEGADSFAEAFGKLLGPMFAAMQAQADAAGGKPAEATGTAKRKRRGRKKADYKTVQKEAALAAEWERARDTGIYKPDFAKGKKMTARELDALLDRVAKRKRPSE